MDGLMGSKLNDLFMDEHNKRANIIHSVALEISLYIENRKISNFDNNFKQLLYISIVFAASNCSFFIFPVRSFNFSLNFGI